MKSTTLCTVLCSILISILFIGCSDEAPSGLPKSDLGNNTISKYVSIGNSLTAGYQSGALFEDGQRYGFPNLIAQQLIKAGATIGTFEQPIWGNPGNPGANGKAARIELVSLEGPDIRPRGLAPGTPLNATLNRPYDNLGIPGAMIADFFDTTDVNTKLVTRQNLFFKHVLRDQSKGKSVFEQAKNISPKADLISFWLGNNDVLLYAVYGGVIVAGGTVIPNAPTSATTFDQLYKAAIDSLKNNFPSAKIIVANIPDIKAIPYFTTVNPGVVAKYKGVIPFSYQKHGNRGVGDGVTYFTEPNPPLLTLASSAYIGKKGEWYRDNNVSVPSGIDTNQTMGIDYTNPIPDALILDSLEQAEIAKAVAAYNTTIASVATSKNLALVDIHTIFNDIKKNGFRVSGETYTADYVSGGLFSLDGIHPTGRGAGILANEFIKVLNAKYGMHIPYVDISQLPGIPAPLGKYAAGTLLPKLSPQAVKNILELWHRQ